MTATCHTIRQKLENAAESGVKAIADSLLTNNFKLSIQEREALELRIIRVLEAIEGAAEGLNGDKLIFVKQRLVEELERLLDERIDELGSDY